MAPPVCSTYRPVVFLVRNVLRQVRAAEPKPAGFCRRCGSAMEMRVPAGEREQRLVCTSHRCGWVEYVNPKMVRCWQPFTAHQLAACRLVPTCP